MNSIEIYGARPYKIGIGRDILKDSAKYARWEHPDGKVMIITDDMVNDFYCDKAAASFEEAGFEVHRFVFPAGEKSKSLATADKIYGELSEKGFDRSDMIVALGGGVVGDLAGFAASTYMRGIDYMQIPTSLLSMVDAAIGGKTGVDTSAGKNTVGTFFQPMMVLCDLDCLDTLEERQYRSGLAEMVKYGVLAGEELFGIFEDGSFQKDIEGAITMCINVKKSYVEQDPYDQHMRKMLNLGHTIGHAVEACSGYEKTHGEAVAIGMVSMAELFEVKCADRIRRALENCGFDQLNLSYGAKEIATYMAADKKKKGDHVLAVVPGNIGACSFEQIPLDALEGLLSKVCTK